MRAFWVLLFAIGIVLGGWPATAQTTLRAAYGLPKDSHFGDGFDAFAAELERLSNGKFKVQQLPSYQGGNERAIIESVQLGSLQLGAVASAALGNFVPEVEVLDLPFLFRDTAHARAVHDGPQGRELLAKVSEKGLIGLALGEAGFRHVTNNKRPISRPEDMSGVKIRTMQSDIPLTAFTALGSMPTPMSWSEVYTALQTGALDAQENAISIITASRVYEVQKHLSLTGHTFTNIVWIASPAIWNRLSEPEKGWFREAAAKGVAAERARVDRDNETGLAMLRQRGVTVTEVDRNAFKQAVSSAYGAYEKRFGKELIDRIASFK